MSHILLYLKKLHAFAGWKLYLNFIGMTLISLLEGVGIFLLIPMLGLIGLFSFSSESIPMLDWMNSSIGSIPEPYGLPVILGIYFLLIVLQALLQRGQTILNVSIQQGFIRYLRIDTYEGLLRSNWLYLLKRRKSDFNHILTMELARVSMGTHLALRLLTSLVFTLIQISIAFYLSPLLTLFVLGSGIVIALLMRRLTRHAKSLGDETTELSESYFAGITDQLNGLKDIKSNLIERTHLDWFRRLCLQIERNNTTFARLQATSQWLYKIISALLVAVFAYIAVEVLQAGGEQLMLIVIIFSRLWPRFASIQTSIEQIISNLSAYRSLMELRQQCAEAQEEQPPAVTHRHHSGGAAIECRNVFFKYDKADTRYALEHIQLYIPANSMTAVVGKSGAGKSTLIDVLIGLLKPDRGILLADGVPLSGDKLLAYRSSVSVVSQEPFLFHASIRDNLLLVAPEATEQQLWEALRFSASDQFVRKLPQGLDTVLGDRGVRLSGGERQRIVLARAILRKPSVLVLDEATSALDTENEAVIQEALERLKGSMTMIVIAHRLSTIRHADQVIVMEDGRIVQQGSYGQLSQESKGSFRRMLEFQDLMNTP